MSTKKATAEETIHPKDHVRQESLISSGSQQVCWPQWLPVETQDNVPTLLVLQYLSGHNGALEVFITGAPPNAYCSDGTPLNGLHILFQGMYLWTRADFDGHTLFIHPNGPGCCQVSVHPNG